MTMHAILQHGKSVTKCTETLREKPYFIALSKQFAIVDQCEFSSSLFCPFYHCYTIIKSNNYDAHYNFGRRYFAKDFCSKRLTS